MKRPTTTSPFKHPQPKEPKIMHTKHTPGPWACPHGARVYGADSHLVAETSFEHRGTTETEANAALMSAAPEMLAALMGAIETADGTAGMSEAWWYAPARVAIARATGSAP